MFIYIFPLFLSTAMALSASTGTNGAKLSIDHLVFVVPSLVEAMNDLEAMTGVAPAVGGRHAATLGIQSAFLSLGEGRYLELLAPYPDGNVPFESQIGPRPRLSTFCCDAGSVGLDELVKRFQTLEDEDVRSLLPSTVEEVSDTNSAHGSSSILWRIAGFPSQELPFDGAIPLFVDWGKCRSFRPATMGPTGCTLVKLEAYHPDSTSLKQIIRLIGMGLEELLTIREGAQAQLVATLETPKGLVRLS